jgi:hypothetical protein
MSEVGQIGRKEHPQGLQKYSEELGQKEAKMAMRNM